MTRARKLVNEVIFFVPEAEWDPQIMRAIRGGGTKQIEIQQARDFRTPFGNRMVITTLSTIRTSGSTWDLRDYVARLLTQHGYSFEISDILSPGRAKSYSVD